MALLLATNLETGVTAEYWRVVTILTDYHHNEMVIQAGLYVDLDRRLAGAKPLLIRTFLGALPEQMEGDQRAAAYGILKATEAFEGAEEA